MPIHPDHEITGPDELLHRNVHPTFVINGRLTSSIFKPKKSDAGELSVQRDSLAPPPEAHRRYTQPRIINGELKSLSSAGTCSVSVGQCASVGLKAYADPLTDEPPDDSHALVDMKNLSTSARERKAKDLIDIVGDTNWTYQHNPA